MNIDGLLKFLGLFIYYSELVLVLLHSYYYYYHKYYYYFYYKYVYFYDNLFRYLKPCFYDF